MASTAAKRHMAALERQGQTETVTYRPGTDGLAPREISAIVERPGPDEMMQGRAAVIRVTALNDADVGIPAEPTLSDVGTDRIDVAERVGGTPAARGVQRFVAQDADWVTVECQ